MNDTSMLPQTWLPVAGLPDDGLSGSCESTRARVLKLLQSGHSLRTVAGELRFLTAREQTSTMPRGTEKLRDVMLTVMLHIAAHPRSPALAPFIASFHYHEGELVNAVERILPTGQAYLMVNLDEDEFRTYDGPDFRTVHRSCGAVLAGPHGRTTAIDTNEQSHLIAVEFRVGGAAAFLPMPLSEACEQVLELDDVWRREGGRVRERLCEASSPAAKFDVLEAVLLKHISRSADPAIALALSALESGVSVSEAGSRAGLLPKTLVRRFREQVGLAPKQPSRVQRLQRLVSSIYHSADLDWCQIAAQHGYADQAHLIHDFRALTGITPTAYRPSSPQRRNHVPLSPPAA